MPTRSIGQNGKPHPTGAECFEAMRRHHSRGKRELTLQHVGDSIAAQPAATIPASGAGNGKVIASAPAGSDGGDILYGAMAIARFMFPIDFDENRRRARRRVFNLWAFYEKRKERSGFLKLKGALCLSKAQWRKYHGFD